MEIPTELNSNFKNQIESSFDTCRTCFEYLKEHFPTTSFFFRGESQYFERTTPGTVRVLSDSNLHFQEQSLLIDLASNFEEWCEKGNLPLGKGQMFLQHYGLPTDLLDITSSLKIGLYFAYKDNPTEEGYVAVIDKKKASSEFEIFDLSDFTFLKGIELKRPKLQKALAIRHKAGNQYDLKQANLISTGIVKWFSFKKQKEDDKLFSDLPKLLDNKSDESLLYLSAYISDFCLSTWQHLDLRIEVCQKLLKKIYQ